MRGEAVRDLHQSYITISLLIRRLGTPNKIAAYILILHAYLVALLAYYYSPTLDEIGHLPAGISVWEFGRFDLYRVNPPLVKTVAALPVLAAGVKRDWTHFGDTAVNRPEWSVGRAFVQLNGPRALWLWTLARWACIPFSLVGGYVCYRWAGQLFGSKSALVALALWCFSPNILAYGAMILPDLAATSLGILAAWTFRNWLRQPCWSSTLWAGLAMGLAELAKMTWIILFILFPLIWVIHRILSSPRSPRGEKYAPGQQLIVILVIGLYILNLGYIFDGSFTPLRKFTFYSHIFNGFETGSPGNRFRGTWLERVPVPFPKDYITGIDLQSIDFERGKWSFLRGKHRFGGWWYFYLYALMIKEPLGVWLLLAISIVLGCCGKTSPIPYADGLCLLLVPLELLVVLSSEIGFSRYMRYALPVLPFAYVVASRAFVPKSCFVRFVAISLLGWTITCSLWYYPYSFSYCNEMIGGPRHAADHLFSANVDWGQDVLFLKDWLSRHPEARPLSISITSYFDIRIIGLDFHDPPPCDTSGRIPPGWYAISVGKLQERTGRFACFAQQEPVDRIGYSILVYNIK